MKEEFLSELKAYISEEHIMTDEPMCSHTTFKAGGNAAVYACVYDMVELNSLLRICRKYEIPVTVIGNGSNILVADNGYDGVVIRLKGDFENFRIREIANEGIGIVEAGAGMLFNRLATLVSRKGFGGLAYASGIPGTVGGAIYMNAGAYECCVADNIEGASVLMPDGMIRMFTKDELELSYRHSVIMENGGVILTATFKLPVAQRIGQYALMEYYRNQRAEKQPLEWPSAGSFFKRPVGNYAGRLIEECGLKGTRVGDAEVSVKHAGFLINKGHATATDIYKLMKLVIADVEEKKGVTLEPEVRLLGDFE